MAQIFHRSTNTISKVTIYGAVFILGGLGYLIFAVNQSPYYTDVNWPGSSRFPLATSITLRTMASIAVTATPRRRSLPTRVFPPRKSA